MVVELGVVAGEPGVTVVGFVLHALHDIVVALQKSAVTGAGSNAGGIYPAEQVQRIVPGSMPEGFVDGLKQRASLPAPTPPEVHRDACEPLDSRRQIWDARLLGNHG